MKKAATHKRLFLSIYAVCAGVNWFLLMFARDLHLDIDPLYRPLDWISQKLNMGIHDLSTILLIFVVYPLAWAAAIFLLARTILRSTTPSVRTGTNNSL